MTGIRRFAAAPLLVPLAEISQAARLGEVAMRYRVRAVVIAVGANDRPPLTERLATGLQNLSGCPFRSNGLRAIQESLPSQRNGISTRC